jgi:hypothetical protein
MFAWINRKVFKGHRHPFHHLSGDKQPLLLLHSLLLKWGHRQISGAFFKQIFWSGLEKEIGPWFILN